MKNRTDKVEQSIQPLDGERNTQDNKLEMPVTGNTIEVAEQPILEPSLVTPEHGVEPLVTETGKDRPRADVRKPEEIDEENRGELKDRVDEQRTEEDRLNPGMDRK